MNLQGILKSVREFARSSKLGFLGGVVVMAFLLTAVTAPWIAPQDPNTTSVQDSLELPGREFLLGADYNGRDILSRLIYGTRVSLSISLSSTGLGLVAGVLLGILAGSRVDSRVNKDRFRTIVTVMILVLGLSLILGLGRS